ncbi:MAG: asparagine synthase (glutamine-hydrolyzing), partial [Anaerolinea sp.]|nr:asparagine synthase (glutamine-hydrolyzing) [Anaerolinea sp.]
MCGIAGIIYLDGREHSADDIQVVGRMTELLMHRGPDQGRVMADGPVVFGNRRLAILDLSPAGALPMRSADGSSLIAYNGEIYNHPALRRDLESAGAIYASNSDTETLLLLHQRHGPALLDRLRGMFAFVLWDASSRRVLIARDRAGEKPLYYYHNRDVFIFASEIKALLAHPQVPRCSALDARRLALYLSFGCIPAPETAFVSIQALLPGHKIELDLNQAHPVVRPRPYFTLPPLAPASRVTERAAQEYTTQVLDVLDGAVQQALLSDVPLGVFLSGGLDSSLIAALMRRRTGRVRTFSIGFVGDASFDETLHAEQVARYLGTEHQAFHVEPDALTLLPRLVWHHDQPFADSSAIPTFLVSQMTREHVTVALTGDGGDELFAGYERFYALSLARWLRAVPSPIWRGATSALAVVPEGTGYYDPIKRVRRFVRAAALPESRAYFDWVRVFSADLVHQLSGQQKDPAAVQFDRLYQGDGVNAALAANFRTYLPDDLLVKTDRSSMAVSLETRAPFLDVRVIEVAARIPLNLKLRGRTTKYILRRAARGLLPDAIIDRPKHGFGVPLGAWLRRDQTSVRDL